MDAVTGHDIGFAAENSGRRFFDIHQTEKAEFSFFVIKEQVNIRIIPPFVASRRTKQIQVLHTKLFQLSFMFP